MDKALWQTRLFASTAVLAFALAAMLGDTGCSCTTRSIPRSYDPPSVEDLLAHLSSVRQRARSFRVESNMDYWMGKDRVRGDVLLMGEVGKKMRINALNPTGDNVAADLACDGAAFQYIDYNSDCQLTGPCTRESVAQLLRVSLEPDDFLLLVMGTTPVIPEPRGTITWDAGRGYEVLDLTSGDGALRQTISLNGRDKTWDVVSSLVRDAAGNKLWSLENKDFHPVTGDDGSLFRVPRKTRFTQPQAQADLLVRWNKQTMNPTLDPDRFRMTIPAGLRPCG